MGAAAGKQFQSEKAKHAEAVLNAVHLFEETNDQEEDSYRGGFSTDFFKKKVKLAASDAKSKGKDIDKSLAHLTEADLDMLAHYDENRKDEVRRQAGNTTSSMQVEEIVDDEIVVNNDNGGDNIDETTSVLSYGDDEEEAAEHDELDSSDELIENIEEVVESRPRLNSGFKVFPMDDSKEESKSHAKTPEKTKLKLDLPIARPGVADHFAKFWDYEEPTSAMSHAAGVDSPAAAGAGGLQSATNTPGKKFQSPKPNFPYKDRGQRIDERNEALMVLQRQKVISLTQNAQLEREVEALQRQLEKMDQIEQTFDSHRLGDTNRSSGSLNNTSNSSSTVQTHNTSGLQPAYRHSDYTSSANYGSGGHNNNNLHSKYSYIYPIDEEAGQSADTDQSNYYLSPSAYSKHLHSAQNNIHSNASNRAESKGSGNKAAGIVVTGSGVSAAHSAHARRARKGSGAKHSSPSSSDNDSINSYSKNNNSNNNGKFRNNAHSNGDGLIGKAQGKILRVRSNDQSDLSDEFSSSNNNNNNNGNNRAPSQPALGVIGKASSAVYHSHSNNNNNPHNSHSHSGKSPSSTNTNTNTNSVVNKGVRRTRAVAVTAAASSSSQSGMGNMGNMGNDGGDSDDSASQPQPRHSGAHAGAARSLHQDSIHNNHQQQQQQQQHAQYKMSQLSDSETPQEHPLHNNNIANGVHTHATPNPTSSASTSLAQIQQGVGRSTKSQAMKIQSKRVISVGVKPSVQSVNSVNNNNHSSNNSHHNSSKNGHSNGATLEDANIKKESDSDTTNNNSQSTHTKSNTTVNHNNSDNDKYRALLDNVSEHLESSLKKHDDTIVNTPSHTGESQENTGGNAVKGAVRTKGGALKKVNKRRHSMDGMHEDTATDNSQDEEHGKFPSRHKFGVNHIHGNMSGGRSNGSDTSPIHAQLTGLSGQGLSHHSNHNNHQKDLNNGANYTTTDDESVGHNHSPNARNKIRKPRAKLQEISVNSANAGNPSNSSQQSPLATHRPVGEAVVGSVGNGKDGMSAVNHISDVPGSDHATAINANIASKLEHDGESVSMKPKRRVRAVGLKAKSEAHLNTGSNNKDNNSGNAAPSTGPWDSTLDQWWAEISLLLRKPILQEEDMLYTVAAAEAGLMYTEEMNAIAKTLNVLRGALSRWILPYDNNTRIDSQCSTPHSVVENMPEEFRGKLTERQVHYLVAGANGVRKLVRVKIADDNDLEQARKALKSTDMFFKALYHRAKESNMKPYELLQLAEKFSYA